MRRGPRWLRALALLLAGASITAPMLAQRAPSAPGATPSNNPPAARSAAAPLAPGEIRLTYLGNAGWEITDGTHVVLVDPFLSQFARWQPGAAPEGPDPDGLYAPDTALINAHVKRADYILITHGHSDHALDAGPIAKRTGAVSGA